MSAGAITSAELAEIKARVDAATPGTWTVDDSEAAIGWDVVATGEDNLCGWVANGAPGEGAFCEEPDARFVAHARTDVPRLVAEVERLNSVLDRYRSESTS